MTKLKPRFRKIFKDFKELPPYKDNPDFNGYPDIKQCALCKAKKSLVKEKDSYLCKDCLYETAYRFLIRAEQAERQLSILRRELERSNKLLEFNATQIVDALNGEENERIKN